MSLVTAYESGAESDSESESEQSNSSKLSTSSSGSRSTKSRSKTPSEDESLDGYKNRQQEENREKDESECAKSMSLDYEQSNNQIKKIDKDNLDSKNAEGNSEQEIKEKIEIENDPNFFSINYLIFFLFN